jgi:hypothetical protein
MGITYQSAGLDELVLLCTNSSYQTLTSIQFLDPEEPDYYQSSVQSLRRVKREI